MRTASMTAPDELQAHLAQQAASVIATPEAAGQPRSLDVATCSLPAFDAEGLEQWLTDRIVALQKERETAHKCNVYSHAERCKNYAAACEAVKLEMRRRMGRK